MVHRGPRNASTQDTVGAHEESRIGRIPVDHLSGKPSFPTHTVKVRALERVEA